ncbi:hypothetical protein ATCC90586_002042 [Pythium insidiosum]|nr:hypothetical protein ATCC90586_002042 [Pythium insidiosum]
MGTWFLFSTHYCATRSSCVLVDAWLQLALCLLGLAALGSLAWALRRGRGRRAPPHPSPSPQLIPSGPRSCWRALSLWPRASAPKTAPLPLALIQKDADEAHIQSHKNSLKHATEFIQQTQRMSRMDLATQATAPAPPHGLQPSRSFASLTLLIGASFRGALGQPSTEPQTRPTSEREAKPRRRSRETLLRKLSNPLPIATPRGSIVGFGPDAEDAVGLEPEAGREPSSAEAEAEPPIATRERSPSFRQRIATIFTPTKGKESQQQRARAATAFEVPSYKLRQQLAELSPEHRTKKERRASVELRHKRRLSVGVNSQLLFQVSGGDQASVYEVKLQEITLVKRLAFGPLSEVYAAVWRDTKVGVKLLMPRDGVVDRLEDAVKNFRREIWVMSALHHPNIVKLIGASLTPSCYVLVMEYMSNGSLYDYLRDEDNFFPQQMIVTAALDVAEGMRHIHASGVLQRDLKSKNCLVSEHLVVKVADFGLSRFKAKVYGEYTFVGTPFWAAPEVIRHESYDEKADVYSFGIVLWELVERRDPYAELNAFQVPLLVANDGLRPADFTRPAPLGLAELMKQCWDSNPDQRPTFDEITDTLQRWVQPAPDSPHALADDEGDLSLHVQRERTSANQQELHRFASSHDANAKAIPIKLSRNYSERLAPRRNSMLLQVRDAKAKGKPGSISGGSERSLSRHSVP